MWNEGRKWGGDWAFHMFGTNKIRKCGWEGFGVVFIYKRKLWRKMGWWDRFRILLLIVPISNIRIPIFPIASPIANHFYFYSSLIKYEKSFSFYLSKFLKPHIPQICCSSLPIKQSLYVIWFLDEKFLLLSLIDTWPLVQ